MDGVDCRQGGERDKTYGHECFIPVIGYTRDRCTSFVPVGSFNQDKMPKSRLEPPTGMKWHYSSRVVALIGTKKPLTPLLPGMVPDPTVAEINDLDQRPILIL